MVVDDHRISNPTRVKKGIYEFFKNHFKNILWKRLTIKDLERPFIEEEVWAAVNGCDGNKALGPDGLNLNFVKVNWAVIKVDFMNFIRGFHKDGGIVKVINNTFIALIPKCGTPETILDFRPRILENSMYKILSRVLGNRLKVVMGGIICE
ncbi:hypothetical protein Ddye_013992 [Dipteronia dyeriana]|uniref:Uncharacterized protein n=1 Tax=Dipteronia dyeriana TaxID=168575 RepID=A0AAD9X748_9ROSI|nr:hypothetical protein Ddye_013992 [Dipteronia dyeriana]